MVYCKDRGTLPPLVLNTMSSNHHVYNTPLHAAALVAGLGCTVYVFHMSQKRWPKQTFVRQDDLLPNLATGIALGLSGTILGATVLNTYLLSRMLTRELLGLSSQ